MRSKVMTARPAARKDTGNGKAKKTVAVASKKTEPIVQMVERRSSPNLSELPKKSGALPIPTSTFVF